MAGVDGQLDQLAAVWEAITELRTEVLMLAGMIHLLFGDLYRAEAEFMHHEEARMRRSAAAFEAAGLAEAGEVQVSPQHCSDVAEVLRKEEVRMAVRRHHYEVMQRKHEEALAATRGKGTITGGAK